MSVQQDDSSSLKIPPSIKQITLTAKSLNDETDRLNKAVTLVGERLKVLNLGITSWLQISIHEEGRFWEIEEVGYAKVNGKWGIALRRATGNKNDKDTEDETIWAFNEGPRDLRILGASLLPALIEKLHTDAEAAVASVARNTLRINELAAALSVANNEPKGAR